MAMKFLSRKLWISILFIPFMVVSCEMGGLGGGSEDSKKTDEPLSAGAVLVEGYECVDLGLSVKWATYNVGAYSEKDRGSYYAWGEIEEKTSYSRGAYIHSVQTADNDWFFTKYCTDNSYGFESFKDDKLVLDMEDDVAHVQWGGEWRMPSPEEQQELIDNCTWTWISAKDINGRDIYGFKVTSKKKGFTDRFIFLPTNGYKEDDRTFARSTYGNYWSNRLFNDGTTNRTEYAAILLIEGGEYAENEKVVLFGDNRERGLSVRAVHP